MSLLQQGDSQGQLCIAYIRKEGTAVRRREGEQVAQEDNKGKTYCKRHGIERIRRIATECYANNRANVYWL